MEKEKFPFDWAFEDVQNMIDEAIEKNGIKRDDLENSGEVFYMNGNDSTAFDLEVNERLCEFGAFYKDGYYAVKLLMRVGSTDVYVYPNKENHQECIHIEDEPILYSDDLYALGKIITDLEAGFEIGPETKDWDRPMSVLMQQIEDLYASEDEGHDYAVTGLLMTFGEDDLAINYLELPENVEEKVLALVEPYCTSSTRGNRESIAIEIKGE